MSANAKKLAADYAHHSERENPDDLQMFVTMRANRQLFGVPVRYVRDVLRRQRITPIPLSPNEVAGSLNLRGRIVTVIDFHKRLRLPYDSADNSSGGGMFVVVEHRGELYSLMVDSVGEVMTISRNAIEKTPANLDNGWKDVSSGIYKMDGELLVIVEIDSLLKL